VDRFIVHLKNVRILILLNIAGLANLDFSGKMEVFVMIVRKVVLLVIWMFVKVVNMDIILQEGSAGNAKTYANHVIMQKDAQTASMV
jgi:hypothetical protein